MPQDNLTSEFNNLTNVLTEAVKNSSKELNKTIEGAKRVREIVLNNVEEELSKKIHRSAKAEEFMKQLRLGADITSKLVQLTVRYETIKQKILNKHGDIETNIYAAKSKRDLKTYLQFQELIERAAEGEVSAKEMSQKLQEIQLDTAAKLEERAHNASSSEKRMLTTAIALNDTMSDELKTAIKLKEAKEKEAMATDRIREIFGYTRDDVKRIATDIDDIIKSPVAIAAYVTEGLLHVGDVLNSLRKQSGIVFSQMGQIAGKSFSGAFSAITQGVIAGPESATEAVGALVREYRTMQFITPELIKNQLALTHVYGLTSDEASRLIREIDYMSDRTAGVTSHAISFARAMAKANSIPVNELLADMADNAGLLARYGSRGVDSFIRMAAATHKMGVELSDVDQLMDKALDPEQFLTQIQQVRQLTGLSFSDPVRLMQLAQSNDIQGFITELRRNLGGRDLSQFGRIQQNAIAGLLGMPLPELQRMMHSAQMGAGKVVEPTAADFAGEKTDQLLASVGNMVDSLKSLTSQIAKLIEVLLAASIFKSMGGGFFGKIPFLGSLLSKGGGAAAAVEGLEPTALAGASAAALPAAGLLSKMGGMGAAAGRFAGIGGGLIAGGSAAYDIGKTLFTGGNIGRALERHLFTGVGAALGAVLSPFTLGTSIGAGAALGGIVDKLVGLGKEPTDQTAQGQTATAPPTEVVVNTSALESKMDSLIELFASGKIAVTLDGKKVGALIANAYPRV